MRKSKSTCNGTRVTVRTRIAKATGTDGRYKLDSVRVLPSQGRDQVVVEATDGKQSACIVTPGNVADSRLIPSAVLPTRQVSTDTEISLVDGRWYSGNGKTAEDAGGSSNGNFPPIGDVLPAVHRNPFYESQKRAEKRRRPDGSIVTAHVVVGIDLDVLGKVAAALGTAKLTFFVPVPVRSQSTKPAEAFVDKLICVCPSVDDGPAKGIGIVMPLRPQQAADFYEHMRHTVVESERRSTNNRPRRSRPTKKADNGREPVQSASLS